MGFYQAQKIEKLEARIAALEAALKPFADVAIGMDNSGNEFPDEWLLGHNCLLVGDARRARAAMEGKND